MRLPNIAELAIATSLTVAPSPSPAASSDSVDSLRNQVYSVLGSCIEAIKPKTKVFFDLKHPQDGRIMNCSQSAGDFSCSTEASETHVKFEDKNSDGHLDVGNPDDELLYHSWIQSYVFCKGEQQDNLESALVRWAVAAHSGETLYGEALETETKGGPLSYRFTYLPTPQGVQVHLSGDVNKVYSDADLDGDLDPVLTDSESIVDRHLFRVAETGYSASIKKAFWAAEGL